MLLDPVKGRPLPDGGERQAVRGTASVAEIAPAACVIGAPPPPCAEVESAAAVRHSTDTVMCDPGPAAQRRMHPPAGDLSGGRRAAPEVTSGLRGGPLGATMRGQRSSVPLLPSPRSMQISLQTVTTTRTPVGSGVAGLLRQRRHATRRHCPWCLLAWRRCPRRSCWRS